MKAKVKTFFIDEDDFEHELENKQIIKLPDEYIRCEHGEMDPQYQGVDYDADKEVAAFY